MTRPTDTGPAFTTMVTGAGYSGSPTSSGAVSVRRPRQLGCV
ncbi:hypothetical protein ABZ413_17440 [Nocardia rhamnosiphila]